MTSRYMEQYNYETVAYALNCVFEIVRSGEESAGKGKGLRWLRMDHLFLGFSFAFAQLPAAILKLNGNASQARFGLRQ